MRRIYCKDGLTLVGLLLLVTGAAVAQDGAMKDDAGIMAPDRFQQQVESKGGRVDFVFGDDRPFPECHASTIVQADNGDLVCAWFGGAKEKNPDVGIWMARFSNGAWSNPALAAKVNQTAHWNPVLFRGQDGTIYLFFKVGPEIPFWQTYWKQSKDNGVTWTEPVELVPGDKGGRGPVKDKPIILSDGSWLAGASTEHKDYCPFADRSTDQGRTWTRSENWVVDKKILKTGKAIQPTLWESPAGKVHALIRSHGGFIWRSDSEDFGRTWSAVYATDLPNNNSGIDLLRLEDGRLLLLYNPIGKNWGPRTPLDMALSIDDGATWKGLAHLENDPDLKSEYSYPAIVRTKTGIAVCYTWLRQRIRCWQIPLEAL
jgi:predicted neuraminidase